MNRNLFYAACLLVSSVLTAISQGTAFTYQGRLTDNGATPAGNYDLRFAIYDAPFAGGVVGGTLTNSAVPVNNGLFAVTLDFGTGIFTGADRWLEIGVRTNGNSAFTTLSPRQKLTATPYAITAGSVTGIVPSGGVMGTYANAVTFNNAANNFIGNYTGHGSGLTNVTARSLEGQGVSNFWQTGGNSGTSAGVNFLGTTDNQPLEFKVNGQRALRLEPHTNGAPNVIGGAGVNQVDSDAVGATIAGGGATDFYGSAIANRIFLSAFAVIGGGVGNTIQSNSFAPIIAGGVRNIIGVHAYRSTIGGGAFNIIQNDAFESTIGGGRDNIIQGVSSTISGGVGNVIQAELSPGPFGGTIAGGSYNLLRSNSVSATISGGSQNTIETNSRSATISGGDQNTIGPNAFGAVIPGGLANTAKGNCSFASGSRAQALHDGAFVWSDRAYWYFSSSATNEFAVRATGGVRFVTAVDGAGVPSSGVSLPSGGGSWSTLSDRGAKENFVPVKAQEILERVAALPLTTWNYKSQEKTVRHIGPMAQDFASAFQVGEDAKRITTVDADGVALAAIQGLNEKLDQQLKTKDREIQSLRQSVLELKELLLALGKKDAR